MAHLVEWNPDAGQQTLNAELVPVTIRHEIELVFRLLQEKYRSRPRNRAARRQLERELQDYIERRMRVGFVHVTPDGTLEVVPEELPQPVREWVPDLVESLNRRFTDARLTRPTLSQMSRFVEEWVAQKLSELVKVETEVATGDQ